MVLAAKSQVCCMAGEAQEAVSVPLLLIILATTTHIWNGAIGAVVTMIHSLLLIMLQSRVSRPNTLKNGYLPYQLSTSSALLVRVVPLGVMWLRGWCPVS